MMPNKIIQVLFLFCCHLFFHQRQQPLTQADTFLLTLVTACIMPCDRNNPTHSFTRIYHHIATESPNVYLKQNTSWSLTLDCSFYMKNKN